ncbi:MAG TPA: hypothetical protein GX406_04475 [Pseudoclavibacter sp.]|nr:hypothetical protein [Pseudoclavibacter sp.]
MSTSGDEYQASLVEKRLAAMTVGLIILAVVGIALSLLGVAFSWATGFLSFLFLVVMLALPAAMLLLIAVVVIGLIRRRKG